MTRRGDPIPSCTARDTGVESIRPVSGLFATIVFVVFGGCGVCGIRVMACAPLAHGAPRLPGARRGAAEEDG